MSLIPRHLEQYFPNGIVPNKKNLLEVVRAVPEDQRGMLMKWLCVVFTRYMSHPIGQAFTLVWQSSDDIEAMKRAAVFFILADETDYRSQKDLGLVKTDFFRLMYGDDSVRAHLLMALFRYDWLAIARHTKAPVIRWYFRSLLTASPESWLAANVPPEIALMVETANAGGHAEHADALRMARIEAEKTFRSLGLEDRADELRKHLERKGWRALAKEEHRKLVGR